MKKIISLTLISFLATSCATIFGKTDYPVTLNSSPKGAKVSITNEDGKKIFEGVTPTQAVLKSGESYFDKKDYAIVFSKKGFADKTMNISGELNPWYFGNILIGGPLGLLIIDPLTGAMFKIKQEEVTADLDSSVAALSQKGQIIALSEVPENLRKHLVRVN